MNQLLEKYRVLNSSFEKKLIFRLGVEAGFFSEYNNFIISILYCLKNGISLELYSRFANYTLQDGWKDYFLPFPSVNKQDINKYFNLRYGVERVKINYPLQAIVKPRYVAAIYKRFFAVTYLTQDLWAALRDPALESQRFTFPDLGIYDATLVQAAKPFVTALWKYNSQSASIINSIIQSVALPDQYVSIHVRAGDKSSEIQTYDTTHYMALAQKFATYREAFVLTDDYSVVENLRFAYPDWNFHTLCTPSERGYHQEEFDKIDSETKYKHHLRLFAELDIAAASMKYIGTYSSNIGMYMGMRIGPERCACVDFDNWVRW